VKKLLTVTLALLFAYTSFAQDYEPGDLASNIQIPDEIEMVDILGEVQAVSERNRTLTVGGKRYQLVQELPLVDSEDQVVGWGDLKIGDQVYLIGFQAKKDG